MDEETLVSMMLRINEELDATEEEYQQIVKKRKTLFTQREKVQSQLNGLLIESIKPENVWDLENATELLHTVATREWGHGRGDRELHDFLEKAFRSQHRLIYSFERHVEDDEETGEEIITIYPELGFMDRKNTNIEGLSDALQKMQHVLYPEQPMMVSILHGGDEHDVHLVVNPDGTGEAKTRFMTYTEGALEKVVKFAYKNWMPSPNNKY